MSTPALPLIDLSDDEKALIDALTSNIMGWRWRLELLNAYYDSEQVIRQLGISIPPELKGLHTVMGWPQVVVDTLEERLDVDGFRYGGSAENDDALNAIWDINQMGTEAPLAHLDALVYGRSYVAVGSGNCGPNVVDCPPLITVESPMDMTVDWDARIRQVMAALRLWELDGQRAATLYTPAETISIVQDESTNAWQVMGRDLHNLGVTPVVRMANRQRVNDRVGRSEITTAVMSVTDAACRTLLGLEVAREFFATPQRYILGASESAFQDAAGNPKSAWETYIGHVLGIERDEDGNLPTVGQFPAYDPGTFTRIIDMYARLMSGVSGMPPHYLGYTTDNPASADAIRSTEARQVKRAERKQQAFGGPWAQVMKLALMVQHGDLPDAAHRIQTVWTNPATPTIAAQTDAAVKLVQTGVLPPDSDVTLEMVGLSAVDRARVAAERKRAEGRDALAGIINRLSGQVGNQVTAQQAPAAIEAGSGNGGIAGG